MTLSFLQPKETACFLGCDGNISNTVECTIEGASVALGEDQLQASLSAAKAEVAPTGSCFFLLSSLYYNF
jgi:hypothetical protein